MKTRHIEQLHLFITHNRLFIQRRVTVTRSHVFLTGLGSSDKQIRQVSLGLEQAATAR